MGSDAKQVIRQWFEEVWNEGREDAIFRLFAEDGIAHGLEDGEGNPLVGPAGYAPFMKVYKEAFPDLHFEVVDMVQEGDKVAARCVVRGTHSGAGLGFAPTQRGIEITGMTFVVVREGQIREAWNLFDFRSLMSQLTTEAPVDGAPYDQL